MCVSYVICIDMYTCWHVCSMCIWLYMYLDRHVSSHFVLTDPPNKGWGSPSPQTCWPIPNNCRKGLLDNALKRAPRINSVFKSPRCFDNLATLDFSTLLSNSLALPSSHKKGAALGGALSLHMVLYFWRERNKSTQRKEGEWKRNGKGKEKRKGRGKGNDKEKERQRKRKGKERTRTRKGTICCLELLLNKWVSLRYR